jgi:hypothetical protein
MALLFVFLHYHLGLFDYMNDMNEGIERDLGPQPIGEIMAHRNLKPHDLVAASTRQLTHKMVSRACKGRRLTRNTQTKVLHALNLATGQNYSLQDLFNY